MRTSHNRRSTIIERLESRTLLSTYTITNLNDSGAGSLRDAIQQANNHSGADTINFASGLSGTITLSANQLVISSPLTIDGPGATSLTISGDDRAGPDGMLQINGGVSAKLDNLTITAGGNGGAVVNSGTLTLDNLVMSGNTGYYEGGIWNQDAGTLTITNSSFTDNTETALGSGGGAIFNDGRLTITNSSFSRNAAQGGGTNLGFGGAIDSERGTVALTNCTLSENSAPTGGAAEAYSGSFTVSNCTFATNAASNAGGAIDDFNGAALVIKSSTFSANMATGDAGSIENGAGVLTVSNSTFANNQAGGNGGAIWNGHSLTSTNCTFAGNTAAQGGGIYINSAATLTTVNNTIVATNHDASGSATDLTQSSGAKAASGSHNLIGTGGSGGLSATGNLLDVADAKLGALADNGGPTQTMLPLPGSPAIDAGSNSLASALKTDQRGLPRVSGAAVDIGAVEVQVLPGDANNDGKVDFSDLLILAQNDGQTSGATVADGDFDGDGAVGFSDLLILAQNYGHGMSPAVTADIGRHSRARG